jgi:hypothetical protein
MGERLTRAREIFFPKQQPIPPGFPGQFERQQWAKKSRRQRLIEGTVSLIGAAIFLLFMAQAFMQQFVPA